jgi:hypothetical protein
LPTADARPPTAGVGSGHGVLLVRPFFFCFFLVSKETCVVNQIKFVM